MKDNKEKIEFWTHKDIKQKLKEIADKQGCSIAEIVRKGVEAIVEKYENKN